MRKSDVGDAGSASAGQKASSTRQASAGQSSKALAGIDPHRVEVLAPDELHPRDVRLRRLDVLLDERDAVDRRLELVAGDVARQRLPVAEQPHPEPLAGPVVLGDERRLEFARRLDDPLPADRRDGGRRADAARFQRRVLRHLAHLELQRPPGVQHAPAVTLQPGQHRRGVLRPVAVAARMRRRAHPVVEDALRGRLPQVEGARVEEPLGVRQPALVERGAQRLDPDVVLVEDVDAAHAFSTA